MWIPRLAVSGTSVRAMDFRMASAEEIRAVAVMRWKTAARASMPTQPCDAFADAFVAWAQEVAATHIPFVVVAEAVLGSAWLAVVPRAPDPGMAYRANGDLQTVFVAPEHRDQGVGEALLRTVLEYAWKHGLNAVTVAANARASSLYHRVGFVGDPLDLRLTAPGPTPA